MFSPFACCDQHRPWAGVSVSKLVVVFSRMAFFVGVFLFFVFQPGFVAFGAFVASVAFVGVWLFWCFTYLYNLSNLT
jgi:hypothetical protein